MKTWFLTQLKSVDGHFGSKYSRTKRQKSAVKTIKIKKTQNIPIENFIETIIFGGKWKQLHIFSFFAIIKFAHGLEIMLPKEYDTI